MYYKISNGSISFDGNVLLEDINFQVNDNEKIGLVGRNGTGKTTLLKAIIGEVDLEDGYDKVKVEKTNDFTIGYIKQNLDTNPNTKMIDYILDAYKKLISIEKEIKSIEEKMATDYNDKLLIRYNQLTHDYIYNGGHNYKKEYELALKKFGFTSSDKEKKLSEFSGGQLTKLSFIKLLLSKPDLLILDEPTNHLDIITIEWLEEYLKNYNKSIILVSHDQMFLDNVCNIIYDIEFGCLKRYVGNYTSFVRQKEDNFIKQEKDYKEQQKEIKRLQTLVDRFKYKPSKASFAMSKLRQIERMVLIDKPQKESTKSFKINFDPDFESYREVLKIKNLSIGYDHPLATISLKLERGDKLGIIGENGIGKSTLLKTLIGELKPLSGKFTFGEKTTIAYFSQQLDNLNPNNTIYDEIDKEFPSLSPQEIRTLLGCFEFTGEEVFKQIKELSGGEKVRVSLCKILYTKPNVLILDEPTNHLDIISKNTIKNMLNSYKGTIIMVSHDRYLIKNITNKLLVFNKNSTDLYPFGYEEYLQKRVVEEEMVIEKKEQIKKEAKVIPSKEINRLERKIIKLEEEAKKLHEELFKKEVYTDRGKTKQINDKLDSINKEINELTSTWESLI